MDKENKIRGIIVGSFIENEEKVELLKYLEEIIEKANRYDSLCK